jgi:hypothetical protein
MTDVVGGKETKIGQGPPPIRYTTIQVYISKLWQTPIPGFRSVMTHEIRMEKFLGMCWNF